MKADSHAGISDEKGAGGHSHAYVDASSHPYGHSGNYEGTTLYYDDQYGAVYDQNGRMVRAPEPRTLDTDGYKKEMRTSDLESEIFSSPVHQPQIYQGNPPSGSDERRWSNKKKRISDFLRPGSRRKTDSSGIKSGNGSDQTHYDGKKHNDVQAPEPAKIDDRIQDTHDTARFSHYGNLKHYESNRSFNDDFVHFNNMDSDKTVNEGKGWDSAELLKAAQTPDGMRMVQLELEEEEDSPYPEVRASVSNMDDPEMPALTFRSLFLGLGLASLVSAANVLLSRKSHTSLKLYQSLTLKCAAHHSEEPADDDSRYRRSVSLSRFLR